MFSSPGADGQQERGLEQQDSRGRCGIWCVGLRDLKKTRTKKKKKPAQKEGNRVFPQQNTNDHPAEKETKCHHPQLRDALGQPSQVPGLDWLQSP